MANVTVKTGDNAFYKARCEAATVETKSNAEILPLLEIRIRRIVKAVERLNPDDSQYDEFKLRLLLCLADAIERYCALRT